VLNKISVPIDKMVLESRQRLRESEAIVIIRVAQTLSVVGFECSSRQIAAEAKYPQLAFSEQGNVAR
jgi:hypothetical protein